MVEAQHREDFNAYVPRSEPRRDRRIWTRNYVYIPYEVPHMSDCDGICLTAADIGLPEYGAQVIAYAHPDCPEHGDPLEEYPEAEICGGGDESLRYVREEDVSE